MYSDYISTLTLGNEVDWSLIDSSIVAIELFQSTVPSIYRKEGGEWIAQINATDCWATTGRPSSDDDLESPCFIAFFRE